MSTNQHEHSHKRPAWRPCPGFPDYLVCEDGTIMRATSLPGRPAGSVVQPYLHDNGYLYVRLSGAHGTRELRLHRLVCQAWHGAPQGNLQACHNDGDRTNNASANLRWATAKENAADKHKHGTHRVGSQVGGAKLTEASVEVIKQQLAAGETCRAIAGQHGVAPKTIQRIMAGRTWRHVVAQEVRHGQ
jgi:hypothetical protein